MWRIMKSSIGFIKKYKVAVGIFFGLLCLPFLVASTSAASSETDSNCWKTNSELNIAGQNDILYYCPGNCVSNTPGTLCGDTAIEKYWSAISQYVEDPIDIAGIMGNIRGEGDFNPVEWEAGPTAEGGGIDSNGNLYLGWDYYFNGNSSTTGVGAVAITWDLGHYLNYVNDNYPDLLKYYKDTTEYAYNWLFHPNGYRQGEESYGDDLLEKIGDAEFDKLVALDVEYFMEKWPPTVESDKINNYVSHNASSPGEAAAWWAVEFEGCQGCQYGTSVVADRAANAEYFYDLLKDFKCSGSSSDSSGSSSPMSTVSGDQITWIGDSYSVQADNKGLLSENFSGLDIGPGSNNTSTSYIQGSKFVSSGSSSNPSCLSILQDIIDSGSLRPYLVFACGTNGGWSDSDITTFTDLLKDRDTKAIVVTSKIPNNDYATSNDRLKSMVEANDNIYLADWTSVYEDSYFNEDPEKIHPVTDPGYEKWVSTIATALSDADSKDCTTYDGEYPEYLQGEEPWGSMSYGSGTMADSGCGAASMAMLATVATGQDIYPNDIANLLGNQYYDSTSVHVLDPIVGEHYGFEVINDDSTSVEETKTKFRQYLKDGYMIHFTGAGCYPGFQSGDVCSNGHVIGIFSIDDNDVVMQANSGWGGNQESSLDDIAKAKTWSAFTAIKGSNSSKNTCSGLCSNSNSGAILDGITEEQAQKIADYYNSNEVTASNFIGGFIPSDYAKVNCVSFSYWFVSAFTDAAEISPIPSLVGDGSYIADTGLPSIGWETGNDPTPFSVFGGAGSSAWSHTGVVVGATDDGDIITIEAAYAIHDARVLTRSPSYFAEGVGILAYPGDHITPNEGHLGNKSLYEIIGN